MKLLVCGGRDFENKPGLYAALDAVHRKRPVTLLIHGGAVGAELLAVFWAKERGIPFKMVQGDWDELSKPDGAVAFVNATSGTDMVDRLDAAGIQTWIPNIPPLPWYQYVQVGDVLTPTPHWNKHHAPGSQLPSCSEVLCVQHIQRGCQSGVMFLVTLNDGQRIELDAEWFEPFNA